MGRPLMDRRQSVSNDRCLLGVKTLDVEVLERQHKRIVELDIDDV